MMKIEWNKNRPIRLLIGFEYEKFIGSRELTIWFLIGNIIFNWEIQNER